MAKDPYIEWLDEDAARLDALAKIAKEKGYTVKLFKGKKKNDGKSDRPSGRSLWQDKIHFPEWKEARSLTVSIDFDRTFSADPKLWGEFAREASDSGNTVVMITRREDTEKNRAEIESVVGDYANAFDSVILAGGNTQKEAAAKQAGIKVDIWIDDSPQTIKSRAFCATGQGGGIDNSCSSKDGGGGSSDAGGEKQGEFDFAKDYAGQKLASDPANPFTEADGQKGKIDKIKTKDGNEIAVVDRGDVNQSEYLDEIESDGEARGFIVDFDTAKDVGQDETPITNSDEGYGPYAAFVGDAYGVLNGQDDVSSAEDTIDMHGTDYGTFDEDMAIQMVDERLDEQWSEISKDPEDLANELGRDDVEAFKEELASGSLSMADIEDEWKTNNRDDAYSVIEDQRNEARQSAVEGMRNELESNLARSTLNCCIQLYRGMSLGSMAVEQAIQSGFIVHEGANSWTTSRDTARGFGAAQVLLVCRNPRAGHVYRANLNREQEVTRPPSRMRITGVVKTKTGTVLYVDEDEDYKSPGWDDTVRETISANRGSDDEQ